MGRDKKRRRRKPLAGRYLMSLGALSLLGVSGYELWIRFEDFWSWSAGVRHLSSVRGTPFVQDLAIIFEAPEMRQLGYKMLFLVLSIIFSLICLIRRRRARGGWLLMLLDLAVVGAGAYLGLYSLNFSDWAQVLKLVPLALILVGCVVNYIHRGVLKSRKRRREQGGDEHHRDKQMSQDAA